MLINKKVEAACVIMVIRCIQNSLIYYFPVVIVNDIKNSLISTTKNAFDKCLTSIYYYKNQISVDSSPLTLFV